MRIPPLLALALVCFLHFSSLLVNALIPSLSDDVLGLIVFKSDIEDPAEKLTYWNEDDTSPCNWVGVSCDPRSNRVSELNLSDFGLSGKLSRGLFELKFLKKLNLSRNNFTGALSSDISNLSNLTALDLSANSFSGPIPQSLANCSSLVSVNLSSNQFSGSVPLGPWSLPMLGSLDLADNMLEGEITEAINSLKNLRALSLRNNRLSGEVPDGIGDCSFLRSVDLSNNLFSGSLPSKMQNLSLCSALALGANGFAGDIPEWIGEMTSLETLDLSKNSFGGRIPDSFGKLRSLKLLNLSMNALSGGLPDSLSNCANLLAVDVSHNALTGGFPSWVLETGLQKVVFSDNRLSGNVSITPSDVSREQLLVFDISQNELSGEIPPAVGDFESLWALNMARNSFAGPIPQEIGQLKKLSFLDLSENQLVGCIPKEIGLASSLVSLSIAHNRITGAIPTSLAKLSNLQTVDLSFNNLTGTLPKTLSNLVSLRSFNVSHNELEGELPANTFFNTIDPSSLSGNPLLCGAVVNTSCSKVLPKPIVLNPNSTTSTTTITPDGGGGLPPTFARGKKILSISSLIAIGAAAFIVVGVITVTVLNLRVRSAAAARAHRTSPASLDFSGEEGYGYGFSRSPSSAGGEESGKLVMFTGGPGLVVDGGGTHALLSKDRELGRGGFGTVYRAAMGDGRFAAIKRLSVSGLVKSRDDFEREVRRLGQARHTNLVGLDGYYWTSSLQLLIYEFVSGGSLYERLHETGEVSCRPLSWDERFRAIVGSAHGLAQLHRAGVIHYNLKSSNVLIDGSSGEAKVADYGLAKLLPMLDRYVLSSKIQSALGYMAPEFGCKTVKITEKCDVYAFGILVLEIVTGRRPVEYMEDDVVVLADMVKGALEDGTVDHCVDSRLGGDFPADQVVPVMKLGLVCTSQVPSARPDMAEVLNILELIR